MTFTDEQIKLICGAVALIVFTVSSFGLAGLALYFMYREGIRFGK